MAAFFADQLDFILFFYGLAFILLGAVCVSVSHGEHVTVRWSVLAGFAYLYGAGEWLDLIALIFRDTPAFEIGRIALKSLSFIILLEFSRLEAVRRKLWAPGRWIYLLLLIPVAVGGYMLGVNGANVFSRYALGLPGAGIAGVMIVLHARTASAPERRWLYAAAAGLGLFGIAAGAIVPTVPDWAGDVLNYEFFSSHTGMPVQFVRGLLACFVAFSIWGYWGHRQVIDLASARYAVFQHKQFYRTLTALGAILFAGWVLTQVLGDIYKHNIELESKGDIDLISSRLTADVSATDGMVRALANTEVIGQIVKGSAAGDVKRAKALLMLDMEAAHASGGYILDRFGEILVATDGGNLKPGDDLSKTPYFNLAIEGSRGYHFEYETFSSTPFYYASYPLRGISGIVDGVVVLRLSLAGFETDLKTFDRSFALIDREGVVLVTNRPQLRFRTLWPLPPDKIEELTLVYGSISSAPVMKHEIKASEWLSFDGNRDFVRRAPVARGDWSLVTWKVPQGIFASRVLGIIITLQLTIIALVYLVGRERWIHDHVQLERRLGLEELARNLDNRAATDPLTGLFNRRKFDECLASEIARAQRYQTPLSLVLFDIDHFKVINDTYGHQVGDTVLIELSRYAGTRIRESDVLARWGGEEFVVLCPNSTGPMACQLAGNLLDGIRAIELPAGGPVSCSFGVVQFVHGDTAETFLARGDDALYRAKENGRGRVELAPMPVADSPSLQPVE